MEVEERASPVHQHLGTDSSGSSGHWSLLCSDNRCNTGAESLTGAPNIHPQPSGTNATAGGQIPPHPSKYLGAAWPGQAGGHQGGVVPSRPSQSCPAAPSKAKQAKDSDEVSHRLATPRCHPSQGREAVFPWEGAGALTEVIDLPNARIYAWRAYSQSTPCHHQFLTIMSQLWSARQAKVYLCALLD